MTVELIVRRDDKADRHTWTRAKRNCSECVSQRCGSSLTGTGEYSENVARARTVKWKASAVY